MSKYKKESTREPMSPDYLYDQEHARSADECLQALRHSYNGLIDDLEAEREKVRALREALADSDYALLAILRRIEIANQQGNDIASAWKANAYNVRNTTAQALAATEEGGE